MRSVLAALALSLTLATRTEAQRDKAPARPAMPAAADTNDDANYYELGMALLQRDAEKAANAFYWATQLNPASADAFYARRVALLMSNPRLLPGYWSGDRRALRDRDVMKADSLYLHALTLNPFFYRRLDGVLFGAIIKQIASDAAGASDNPSEIEYAIDRYLKTAPADLRAWQAYSDGRFEESLKLYATAIKGARRKAPLRIDRARLFYQLDHADSALAELTLAAEEMRKADKKDLVFVYESKAMVEHNLGVVQARLGTTAAARESFARALQEDLSYGPAHIQLGFLALDAKDTAAAVSELDLAAQITPNEPVLRYQYGYTLEAFGKHAEAEAQLRKAISLDAVYAAPHFTLAQAIAAQGRKPDAAAEFRAFLALAAKRDPRRDDATKQLAALGGTER